MVAQKYNRGQAYMEFIVLWEKIEGDKDWEGLRKLIGAQIGAGGTLQSGTGIDQ
ncbi:MAG: hypothetical protein MUO40_03215 [Anaerolineaceae bacterium]|nr:hypothetical protein [Anaerolineaceae bacterium]